MEGVLIAVQATELHTQLGTLEAVCRVGAERAA
jgi:hypothetical protein